jgi:hypothetical protein
MRPTRFAARLRYDCDDAEGAGRSCEEADVMGSKTGLYDVTLRRTVSVGTDARTPAHHPASSAIDRHTVCRWMGARTIRVW